MTYKVIITPEAQDGIEKHFNAGNKKLVQKIYNLLEEIAE